MNKIKRVYIEITNKCNLRCSFCAFHHRPFREMTLNEFEQCINQIRSITPYIYLHVQGEPLLHPQFEGIMNLCDQYEMQVQLVTNGTFIHQYPKLASHPSLRKISFSLHSLDYQTINTQEYIQHILEFVNQYIESNVGYVELRFWVSDHLNEKATFALNLVKEMYTLKETSKPNSYKLDERIFLHFEKEFVWPSNSNNISKDCGTCRGAKDMIAILADGCVVPCCLDCEGAIQLGNIFTQSLVEIMNSPRYLNIIKGFNENKLIEPLCINCEYRKRFD
ncbi:radical SAM/SPASM domain-containing protein [Anaerorhabdus sp.]|uniref:radical SAM/SPASM domain-containing protein n=1 Tax=Anaerorhabdus sp. TaxID=1872524 RepID=UPI002FCA49A8